MKVVMVGAGRLATNLGVALSAAGHEILSVYSQTIQSASELAAKIGGVPTDIPQNLPCEADVYIVAVKDSGLEKLLSLLCKKREDQVFVHTAGSMPMDIFKGAFLHYGVFYPMQSFSKERIVDFSKVSIFLEANDQYAMQKIEQLAYSISQHVSVLSSEKRKYLHLAAVFACNFVNHCYALSAEILEKQGIAFDAMLPLIDETAQKVHYLHPKEAQTGPAVRFDKNVIDMQSRLLDENLALKDLYERISLNIYRKAND